jgi:hypothetical protein
MAVMMALDDVEKVDGKKDKMKWKMDGHSLGRSGNQARSNRENRRERWINGEGGCRIVEGDKGGDDACG